MARLIYQGVELQILLTREMDVNMVPDPSGTDKELLHVRIAAACVWNPRATASRGQAAPVAGGNPPPLTQWPPPQGDRLGVSLVNLRNLLMQPRGQLIYAVGNDTVFSVPAQGAPCDANNGPRPIACRVLNVLGDKTALVEYEIECWLTDTSNLVLTNRWSMTQSVNAQFFTTQTYRGRASFRSDLLQTENVNPDQFRWQLLPPIPDRFRRNVIDVQVAENGREIYYEVQDEQQALCLGAQSLVTDVDGMITTGSDSPVRDVGGIVDRAAAWWDKFKIFNPISNLRNTIGAVRSALPKPKANAIVRVQGAPEASKDLLAYVAASVALDRLAPLGGVFGFGVGGPIPVSAYLSASVSERMVEFRMEAFIGVGAIVNGTLDPLAFQRMQRLDDGAISANGAINPPFTFNSGQCPVPPNSAGTRGSYTGLLLAQLLGVDGQPPAAPALPPENPGDLPLQ